MKKVTYKAISKFGGTAWAPKKVTEHTIVEFTDADDAAIRTRALALNWQLISIEVTK